MYINKLRVMPQTMTTDVTMNSNGAERKGRSRAFCLDRWLVKPDCNELICENTAERRTLEPRLMHLLCLLAVDPQQVVTRDELMEVLWPRVIVNENSLTRAVSELRKKLGEGAAGNSLIDTIPKTGYRLAAECYVSEAIARPTTINLPIRESAIASSSVKASIPANRFYSTPVFAAAASIFVTAAFTLLMQFQTTVFQAPAKPNIELADINLSAQTELNALIAGRVDTVSTHGEEGSAVELGSLNSTLPVISKDGDLFAYVRYNDQGSNLILASTQFPESPVTVFTTADTISNLQWSPVDRALLFAQTPKLTPAALLPRDDQSSLVMFDLETFATRVLLGPGSDNTAEDTNAKTSDSFKLTALTRHFDWLS